MARVRFLNLKRKISLNPAPVYVLMLFFRTMFPHRRRSGLQLFCSFWIGQVTVPKISQLFYTLSLSSLAVCRAQIEWPEQLYCVLLFSISDSSVLPGAYESLPRATCRRRNSGAQTCFSKRRAYCIWAQSLPHGDGRKMNLNRRELVLQSTEKTKGLWTDITLQENV